MVPKEGQVARKDGRKEAPPGAFLSQGSAGLPALHSSQDLSRSPRPDTLTVQRTQAPQPCGASPGLHPSAYACPTWTSPSRPCTCPTPAQLSCHSVWDTFPEPLNQGGRRVLPTVSLGSELKAGPGSQESPDPATSLQGASQGAEPS